MFENESQPHKSFQDQEFAGKVLENINPKSQKDLREILQRTLKNWDKSVEQFPFWLRNKYGVEKLRETFTNLELTEVQKDKLNTMKWWLRLNISSA